jgi:hypothetical protein
MAIKTFTTGEVLTASDTNTYLANSGLVYVTSATVGTGVSTVTVSSAFNSTYDSYKIVYDGGVASTALTLTLTFGASATGYSMALPYVTYGTAVASATSLSNATGFTLAAYGTANYVGFNFDVASPNLARYTRIQGAYIAETEAGGYFGIHKVASAYTAFTLTTSSGTITGGQITVYGYRKG